MAQHKIIYFSGEIPQGDPEGDQRDLFNRLRLLSKERDYPVLYSFLYSVTSSLKEECKTLTKSQRELMPCFESVLDLTDHVIQLRRTSLGPAIERVLALVFQLGGFISYHEASPLEYNFAATNTSLMGKGTGLLSAAAISLSPSISMIPRIARDMTRVAFRFGLIVDQVCRSLEVSPDEINAEGAWVHCVHGVNEDDALDAVASFNIKKGYSETSKATVFSVDDTSVSICGPPATLRALFTESDFFRQSRSISMKKVQGMWHTARLYGKEHVRQIVPKMDHQDSHLPLFSPVTGQTYEHTDATLLLEDIMEEILTKLIHWDQVTNSITNRLKQLSSPNVQFIAIQPSQYAEKLLQQWRVDLPSTTLSSIDVIPAVMDIPLGKAPPRDAKSSKIAVVGMACRFPGGANDTETFWQILKQGQDVHTSVPEDRFNAETHVDATGKKRNTSKTPYGCFVENPGLFDASFFGMSPREAEQTDPMHRLALVTAYEALESAGYVHGRSIHTRRVGTFYGQASDDYREVNSGQDIGTYFIPGGCRAFAPGRINYFFKFWGPSFSIDTACSSSLAAIQAACTSLWSSDVDMAIAGGLNILTNSDVYAGLSNGHFLSPTGGCKTWDEAADGYCRADGVGSVILKRLEDAEADNDNILGVVLSAATDHSADAVSITHPHAGAQAHLYAQVVRRAGIDPLDVGYIEMHGTGTQAGDTTEMKSVTSVFAPENNDGHGRPQDKPLYIGSVKAGMGHGEAAAGIMSFMKTLLVLQKCVVPPHIGIKTRLNPSLPGDLQERNVVIPYTPARWEATRTQRKRLAMVNNFGAAGGNTSIILEEATPRPRVGEDTRKIHVIPISAKSAHSLQEILTRLVTYLGERNDVSLSDVAYSLSARKMHYNYRVSVLATSPAEAIDLLQPHIASSLTKMPSPRKLHSVAFAFTGQGRFYTGIGSQLYRDSPIFRGCIDHLDSLAQRQNFPSFLPIVAGACGHQRVSLVSMHLAIVCVEIALARLWSAFGVHPSVVIGHSLGEYAALAIAGVLSDTDAIFLVGTRATLLSSELFTSGTHGMLAVRTSVANIAKAAGRIPYEITCVNGPAETVVGGSLADLDTLSAALMVHGYKIVLLDVAHAYHTSQMNSLLDVFVKESRAVLCKKPTISIISPLYARPLRPDDLIGVSYLAAATRETVNFAGALTAAFESGVVSESTMWLELGHHPTCCGFISRTLPSAQMVYPSLHQDIDNWTTLAKALSALYTAGLDIDWDEYHRPFEPALRLVDTPTYAWNNSNYWIQYRGDWNLTKGQVESESESESESGTSLGVNGFQTSSIHRLVSEQYDGSTAIVSSETSITDSSLQDVVDGHAMNGYGVASSFLHADMAYTLAKRIFDKCFPNSSVGINVTDFEYHDPVVKQLATNTAQPILTTAEADLDLKQVHIKWFNPAKQLWYCHAKVSYEDPSSWLSKWSLSASLVSSRVQVLNDMVDCGKANKLTTSLAYSLFGKLVDYSAMYRTMESVILNGDEAVAEVVFPPDTSGTWTVPPHFIDGVVSLSGFILNGGTNFDNTNNFFVTPSWKSMRFARPLVPGGRYVAYVRMVRVDSHSFAGDVYILQEGEIVGVVEAILFRQWPRVMLNRFFTPWDLQTKRAASSPSSEHSAPPADVFTPPLRAGTPDTTDLDERTVRNKVPSPTLKNEPAKNTLISRSLVLVAEELGVEVNQLQDEARIVDLGLDSLMSLVISQKLRDHLGVEIRDSFFLEISTIGELKSLLK